jgi:hypothetical protein
VTGVFYSTSSLSPLLEILRGIITLVNYLFWLAALPFILLDNHRVGFVYCRAIMTCVGEARLERKSISNCRYRSRQNSSGAALGGTGLS